MSEDSSGTTESDYRWQWLSTIWSVAFGLGFPAVVLAADASVSAPVMASFLLAWGGTVVYIIGPENVKAWRQLKGQE